MANWTRLTAPAAGAFSTTWITRIGVIGLAVCVGGGLLFQSCFSTTGTLSDPGDSILTAAEGVADGRATVQLGARVQDIEQRTAIEAAAAARQQLAAQAQQLVAGHVTPAFNATTGETLPEGTAPVIVPLTDDEAQLREVLRLEAIERHTRSLRSTPVVFSFRRPDQRVSTPAPAVPAQADAIAPAPGASPTAPVSLMDTIRALQALDAQQPPLDAAGTLSAARQLTPPPVSPLGASPTGTVPHGDPLAPAIVHSPNTPPGWERLYEGSFVEAVLVNQLNGDFPGPVLASVAVPVYSADRQRVVIPRGARLVGAASAVGGQDQERLAVGFHRLIFPDGRWVRLPFLGLNQVGEGALKDQVNRHYFAMFAAVGAVGIISGLTVRGSDPYAGGRQGFQAGVGQGLAQSATGILDRFLNRLPTITIRAGHRLRIWLTSDVLVPRPV